MYQKLYVHISKHKENDHSLLAESGRQMSRLGRRMGLALSLTLKRGTYANGSCSAEAQSLVSDRRRGGGRQMGGGSSHKMGVGRLPQKHKETLRPLINSFEGPAGRSVGGSAVNGCHTAGFPTRPPLPGQSNARSARHCQPICHLNEHHCILMHNLQCVLCYRRFCSHIVQLHSLPRWYFERKPYISIF